MGITDRLFGSDDEEEKEFKGGRFEDEDAAENDFSFPNAATDASAKSVSEEFQFMEEDGISNTDVRDPLGKTFEDLKAEYCGGGSSLAKGIETAEDFNAAWMAEKAATDEANEDPSNARTTAEDEATKSAEDEEGEWVFENETQFCEGPGELVDDRTTKPYLTSVPAGYRADFIVMEWMGYLRSHSTIQETLRAIRFYEDIEWISNDVSEELRTVVTSFEGESSASTNRDQFSKLTINDHVRSLQYIGRLEESIDLKAFTGWLHREDQ